MGDTPGLGFWERGGDGRGATMEGEGGGAVIRFGKERERRVGIPHKNLGDPPPQLGITTVLDRDGREDGFGPWGRDQVLVWGAGRGGKESGDPLR